MEYIGRNICIFQHKKGNDRKLIHIRRSTYAVQCKYFCIISLLLVLITIEKFAKCLGDSALVGCTIAISFNDTALRSNQWYLVCSRSQTFAFVQTRGPMKIMGTDFSFWNFQTFPFYAIPPFHCNVCAAVDGELNLNVLRIVSVSFTHPEWNI